MLALGVRGFDFFFFFWVNRLFQFISFVVSVFFTYLVYRMNCVYVLHNETVISRAFHVLGQCSWVGPGQGDPTRPVRFRTPSGPARSGP